MVLSCWGYYIDYSNSGTWVLKFSQEHEIFSFIIGFIVILFVFILLAIRILQRSQLNKANTEEITTKAIKLDEFSAQETVNLMNVYLQEWMHRDDLFWKQVFKFFYAILIVILLPQISNFIKVDISFIKNKAVFPIIGIVFSFLFLYIGLAYAYRLDASGKSYQKVMMLLKNEELMRISINDSRFFPNGKLFNPRISKMMVIVLFFLLFILSSILLLSGKL